MTSVSTSSTSSSGASRSAGCCESCHRPAAGRDRGQHDDAADESVTLDDCQRVSTDVGVVLDVEFDFEHPYTLEVSSPGLDRPLRHLGDCRRFRGRLARFVMSEAVDGQQFICGRIAGVESGGEEPRDTPGRVVVNVGRRVHRIPWVLVTRARLEVEL